MTIYKVMFIDELGIEADAERRRAEVAAKFKQPVN
jgi:hypothetical protein